jgi:hypothetical protein
LGGKGRDAARASHRTVFFYGSFMDEQLLEGAGVVANDVRAGVLWGYEIQITSAATLVRSDRDSCYGIVCVIALNDLDTLYAEPWLKEYRPIAVTVGTESGSVSALCYLSDATSDATSNARPKQEYVDRIVRAAEQHAFPSWYLERLRGFNSN